jgi:hypothetical protein
VKVMTPVYLASPMRSDNAMEHARHMEYAKAAMMDSLTRNESPFVPQLLLGLVLDDRVKAERLLGLAAGEVWLKRAHKLVAYVDLGESEGMRDEMETAYLNGLFVDRRTLPGWHDSS